MKGVKRVEDAIWDIFEEGMIPSYRMLAQRLEVSHSWLVDRLARLERDGKIVKVEWKGAARFVWPVEIYTSVKATVKERNDELERTRNEGQGD